MALLRRPWTCLTNMATIQVCVFTGISLSSSPLTLPRGANAAVCFEAEVLGSLQELGNLVYRGPRPYDALPLSTKATLRVWKVDRSRFACPNSWSPFTPLWGNPNLPHLLTVPDPQVWARYKIKTLGDILIADRLLSLTELKPVSICPAVWCLDTFSCAMPCKLSFCHPNAGHGPNRKTTDPRTAF